MAISRQAHLIPRARLPVLLNTFDLLNTLFFTPHLTHFGPLGHPAVPSPCLLLT